MINTSSIKAHILLLLCGPFRFVDCQDYDMFQVFHLQLILSQGSCRGVAHALTGLCIGLGPFGTSWLILARLFCRGSDQLTRLCIGLDPPGTLWLILARIFFGESVHAEIGLCIGLGPSSTLWGILTRLFYRGLDHVLIGLCIGLGPPGTF